MSSNKVSTPNNYSINIDQEDLRRIYLKEWVLMWCEKYHPEAFIEADRFLKKHFKISKSNDR